jgi:two-component system, repressor protein LuxO
MKPERSADTLLLIEDTPSLRMVYETILRGGGHQVQSAETASEGLDKFQRLKPRVVLLDLMLPDRDGIALMGDMLSQRPETRVIVITSNGSISKAVEAMRTGAHDFLVKPFDDLRFLRAVANAQAASGGPVAADDPLLPPTLRGRDGESGDGFIGSSAPMREVYGRIRSVARSMATVFITGESGTGKELCAQAIHAGSARASGPFIALNCGAIPADLLESEVFGHLKGSFTGAVTDKLGAAAAADGGTLFLDEICEMDMALQTKLLRFLQTSTIQPVGAPRPRKVDVRILCATNRDPMEAVRQGRFREDLYYRLHVVPIHMPALRDRGADVIDIAQAVLERYAREEGRDFVGLDEPVKALFQRLPWPGNVRQLRNVLWNVVLLNEGPLVSLPMLPGDLAQAGGAPPGHGAAAAEPAPDLATLLAGLTMAEIEDLVIEAAIARHDGSIPRAARELDLSPSTLYRKRDARDRRADAS